VLGGGRGFRKAAIMTQTSAELRPGDRMDDGTVCAGISPETGKKMYTTPADAPQTMKWEAAMQYAATLYAHEHMDWRVPTKGELNVLFNNRAAIGGFDETASDAGWYWSSTHGEDDYFAWGQRFTDKTQDWRRMPSASSLRCVRG
jgi:hypothetical protein